MKYLFVLLFLVFSISCNDPSLPEIATEQFINACFNQDVKTVKMLSSESHKRTLKYFEKNNDIVDFISLRLDEISNIKTKLISENENKATVFVSFEGVTYGKCTHYREYEYSLILVENQWLFESKKQIIAEATTL